MKKHLNLELSVNGISFIIDNSVTISQIVNLLPDEDDRFQELLEILATSSSSNIRDSVACKENISTKTVNILLQDKNLRVLKALLQSESGQNTIQYEDLNRMIHENSDPELLIEIAENLSCFANCDSSWIAEKLISFEDPCIRFELATNSETPKHILVRLSEDPDSGVREAASEIFESDEKDDDEDDSVVIIQDECTY